MFKERLKIATKKFLYWLLQAAIALIMISLCIGIIVVASIFPVFETIFTYIAFFLVGLVLLALILVAILNFYEFIKWLFIEPYKEKRKIKS